jgi:pimeloyl-ACP methyl ester carboxylesterase
MLVKGGPIPLDLMWDEPGFVRVSRRLGAFSRILWFEARGLGASEGDPQDSAHGQTFDADVASVLDAVGMERVALVGEGVAGRMTVHFATTHPERVSALVLLNTFAYRDDAAPINDISTQFRDSWLTGLNLEILAPSRSTDELFRAWWTRCQRLGSGPSRFADLVRAAFEQDLRPLLPDLSVPTLVIHREGNRYIPLAYGERLAAQIPGARFVVLAGEDHPFFVGDTDALVDEIEEFLTGARSGADGDVLTMTVLFTDIVASTEHQARVRPAEWSRLTDHHDARFAPP